MNIPSFSRTISSSGQRTKYTNDSHGKLLSGMAQLQKDKIFTDVILSCGELEIHAHKVVLAGSVEYFRSMFTMGMQESSQTKITIENVDASSLETIIHFLYSGEIYIDAERVQTLVETANFLNVKFVVESGGDFLARGLDNINCLGILQFADAYGMMKLRESAKEFALNNMYDILSEEEFLLTSPEIIIEFLKHENLYLLENNVVIGYKEAEALLFNACLNYVRYNVAERLCCLKNLFIHIRLNQLDKDFITKVLQDPLINEDPELTALLENIQHNNIQGDIKPRIPASIQTVFKRYTGMAMTSQAGRPERRFIAKADEGSCVTTHVTGIKIWIRLWDGREVLGGFGIYFSNGQRKFYGNQQTQETYEFNINPRERIVKIEASSGWMVDRLSFITNTGNKFGPYGGDGGDEDIFSAPKSFGFLVGFSGSIINSQESEGITYLRPIWSCFKNKNTRQRQNTDGCSTTDEEDSDEEFENFRGIEPGFEEEDDDHDDSGSDYSY